MSTQRAMAFIEAIHAWASSVRAIGLDVNEDTSPAYEPEVGDDYQLIWEVKFTPKSLNEGSLTIGITREGNPSVGIENWCRVSLRAAVSCSEHTRQRFVAGFEPNKNAEPSTIVDICDQIAGGKFSISAYISFGRLVGCHLSMEEPRLGFLGAGNRRGVGPFLRAASIVGAIQRVHFQYLPWNGA
jgi:hypothetical protein